MKIGIRTLSIKKSFKARTTGRAKRAVKRSVNPLYGKKGMGLAKNPKKAAYNAVYHRTSVSVWDLFKNTPQALKTQLTKKQQQELGIEFRAINKLKKDGVLRDHQDLIAYSKKIGDLQRNGTLKDHRDVMAYIRQTRNLKKQQMGTRQQVPAQQVAAQQTTSQAPAVSTRIPNADYSTYYDKVWKLSGVNIMRPFKKSTNVRGNDVYTGFMRKSSSIKSVGTVIELTKSKAEARQLFENTVAAKSNEGFLYRADWAAQIFGPTTAKYDGGWTSQLGNQEFTILYRYNSAVHSWELTTETV